MPMIVWVWSTEKGKIPPNIMARITNRDDIDYVAHVPPKLQIDGYNLFENNPIFGCCDIKKIEYDDNSTVYVGYHA